ncbi:hypothetical protein BDZ45DRAFT_709264 [Acephala macrosclerotiorum]|nr:hypothetical protein BDZ45DRAFT_709264 [Acephala macrosclerotiorum]
MQEAFIEYNKLVRLRIIRESTNRSNIKYMVSFEIGSSALIERTTNLMQDKIIVYCRTREKVALLVELLQCPSYTSKSGSEKEKAAILSKWIANKDQSMIVATSTLGIGEVSAFSQESGRAGRDGRMASSIVLLHSGWKPQVCREPHTKARSLDVKFALRRETRIDFTGLEERDLEIILCICLYCRVQGRKFNHAPSKCPRRFHWINAKNEAYQTRKKEEKEWIQRYVACWNCYQPHDICRAADPEHEETECRFPDMVMPLCYGVYKRVGGSD